MKHIDLFSGIGGFALAARNTWKEKYENVFFCEIDKFCQAVLRKNFGGDIKIYEDIRTIVTNTSIRRNGEQFIREGIQFEKLTCGEIRTSNQSQIDLLTGGFPCQPFSQAGKRKGTEDDRYLWSEMFKIIEYFKPSWIIGENVAGILNMAEYESESEMDSETDLFGNKYLSTNRKGQGILYRIIKQLEQIGYSVQIFVIPACAVNAPHRRDRVWIVANNNDSRNRTYSDGFDTYKSQTFQNRKQSQSESIGYNNVENSRRQYGEGTKNEREYENKNRKEVASQSERSIISNESRYNTNTERERLEGCVIKGTGLYGQSDRTGSNEGGTWRENWFEVATRFCRVDDGLPSRMDGFEFSKSQHRIKRLKALGNAIVPQVAMEIMNAIKNIENLREK